jgi:deoxyribose-phosphate aldolase
MTKQPCVHSVTIKTNQGNGSGDWPLIIPTGLQFFNTWFQIASDFHQASDIWILTSIKVGVNMMKDDLAEYIEHTLLRPQAVESDYECLCREAVEHGFHGVCIPPSRVRFASSLVKGSEVRVVTVVGFPLGFQTRVAKVCEAENALAEGAQELDMVINIGYLKDGRWDAVEKEISSVVQVASGKKGAVVKVIIETCYLTEQEKRTAVEIIRSAGADFVKTSTGFGPGGAKVEDIALLHQAAQGQLQIKAAGGIRTREEAIALIKAGAARLGTSCGPALL